MDRRGGAKMMIRALCYLRDTAKADRSEIERELAFFRKHRHRMRHHALKEEGIAIGSGVVAAACKTLVTQRLKRSGMRWKIVSGQAVLSFHPLIKSGRFDRTGRVASITGQARSTLTRENGQPTDSNLAQPSSVILLRARTPICASVF